MRLGDRLEPGFRTRRGEAWIALPNERWVSRYAATRRLLDAARADYPHIMTALEGYLDGFPNPPDAAQRPAAWAWLSNWARESGLLCPLVVKAAARTVSTWRID